MSDNYYYIDVRTHSRLMKHAIRKDDKKTKAILSCASKHGNDFKINLDKIQKYFEYSSDDVIRHIGNI